MLSCKTCDSANQFITAEKIATCRDCGTENEFHYGQVPSIEELKAAILQGCNNDKAAAGEFVKDFFWHKEKGHNYAAYFNAYQVQNFGFPFLVKNCIIVANSDTYPVITERPVLYSGTVLLHREGHIYAAYQHSHCAKIIAPDIAKTYAEDIAAGNKIVMESNWKKFAWVGFNYKELDEPVPYVTRKGLFLKYIEK